MPGSEQMLQLGELHPWPVKRFLCAPGQCCPSGDSGASAAVGSRAEQACGDYKMIRFPLRKPSALLNSPVWERSCLAFIHSWAMS